MVEGKGVNISLWMLLELGLKGTNCEWQVIIYWYQLVNTIIGLRSIFIIVTTMLIVKESKKIKKEKWKRSKWRMYWKSKKWLITSDIEHLKGLVDDLNPKVDYI